MKERCRACKGSGKAYAVVVKNVPLKEFGDVNCYNCKGTGYVQTKR